LDRHPKKTILLHGLAPKAEISKKKEGGWGRNIEKRFPCKEKEKYCLRTKRQLVRLAERCESFGIKCGRGGEKQK